MHSYDNFEEKAATYTIVPQPEFETTKRFNEGLDVVFVEIGLPTYSFIKRGIEITNYDNLHYQSVMLPNGDYLESYYEGEREVAQLITTSDKRRFVRTCFSSKR